MKEEKSGGKFFNGLLWGAAIGGAAAYVLSTKRGRDAVKELLHEGFDALEGVAAEKVEKVKKAVNPVMQDEEFVDSASEMPQKEAKDEASASASKKHFFKKSRSK